MESPSNAQAPTFYFNEAVIARQKDKFFFIHLASNKIEPNLTLSKKLIAIHRKKDLFNG